VCRPRELVKGLAQLSGTTSDPQTTCPAPATVYPAAGAAAYEVVAKAGAAVNAVVAGAAYVYPVVAGAAYV